VSVGAASTSQVAILGTRGRIGVAGHAVTPPRLGVRLVTFGALALYATVKWSTMLPASSLARLLGLLALALLLAAGRPLLVRQSRWLAAIATVVALVMVFPVAGIPFAWVLHLRIAVIANAIGEGLAALPQILVPYSGVNQWVTLVIVLGGAVLLFDAALLVAFAPGPMEDLRRAGAALPLVAMAAVPTTLVRPSLPYLDGGLLFALLVAFMWGERIGPRRAGGALALCGLAAVAALFAAPALDQHHPWFNYRALAGTFAPSVVDQFEWSQGYGPIVWPRKGRTVLEIQASHAEYWKAQDLDTFDGVGWQQATGTGSQATPQPDASARRQWTQTIVVDDKDMRGADVIGAGVSKRPSDLSQVSPGQSPGTWTTGSQLVPGDSYRVQVYAPHPSAAELTAAGTDYNGVPAEYLTTYLAPSDNGVGPTSQVIANAHIVQSQPALVFPRFHSTAPITVLNGPPGKRAATLLAGSDASGSRYGDAYRLAQRLAAGAATPYNFALAVEAYLHHGYTYNENPPESAYPLTSFLFTTKLGYCQQFAGAMALLLRMGGVPARVAVGFTSGHPDSATGQWQVTDLDAHAWVEAWFPHYGWVTFDPTPAADPALGGHTPTSSAAISSSGATPLGSAVETHTGAGAAARGHAGSSGGARAGGGSGVGMALAAIAAVAVLALALLATKPVRSVEALVAELEGALGRMGRPLPTGATLAGLERRVAESPDASAYVRVLRVARFGGAHGLPTGRQRRALRRELRVGRGVFGGLRALWALPPRWGSARRRAVQGPDA
jgi:hypothetical protein